MKNILTVFEYFEKNSHTYHFPQQMPNGEYCDTYCFCFDLKQRDKINDIIEIFPFIEIEENVFSDGSFSLEFNEKYESTLKQIKI